MPFLDEEEGEEEVAAIATFSMKPYSLSHL